MRALLVLLGGCAAMPSAAPPLPAPDAYSTAMLALGPTGYWRMEDTTDVLVDETGANNGSYFGSPRVGDPGFDGASVHFDGSQWGEIASRTAYSLSRAWDDFDRTNEVAWGGAWQAQVTTSDHYAVDNHFAYIDPHGDAGTFEQGLPVTLARGNLQLRAAWTDHGAGLQPIALVAERVDEHNFVKAELRENAEAMLELHLVSTVDGQDTDLAAAEVGPVEGWWWLRFEFDGTALAARAWLFDEDEPQTWVSATAPVAGSGTIAIRSANSVSHVRPQIAIQDFRAETLGMTVHVSLRIDTDEPALAQLLGKGDGIGFFSETDQEFHLRYDHGKLKAYLFNHGGGYGAGQAIEVEPARWYDVFVEYDPGDFHDASAGVAMFVDGVESTLNAGSRYHSSPCKPTHEVCWDIDPRNGDAPLRIGTSDGTTTFVGELDEVAIFDRLLSPDEMATVTAARSR